MRIAQRLRARVPFVLTTSTLRRSALVGTAVVAAVAATTTPTRRDDTDDDSATAVRLPLLGRAHAAPATPVKQAIETTTPAPPVAAVPLGAGPRATEWPAAIPASDVERLKTLITALYNGHWATTKLCRELYDEGVEFEDPFVFVQGREELELVHYGVAKLFDTHHVLRCDAQPMLNAAGEPHPDMAILWLSAEYSLFGAKIPFSAGIRVQLVPQTTPAATSAAAGLEAHTLSRKVRVQHDCWHGRELLTPDSAGWLAGNVMRTARRVNTVLFLAAVRTLRWMEQVRDRYHGR